MWCKITDLEAYKGDSQDYNITVKDASDVAINITGYTFFMTIKENATDTDANAKVKKTVTSHTSPTTGVTKISLTGADTTLAVSSSTQKYVYDIRMKDTSGNVTTLLNGVFKVLQPVTLTTT